MKTKSICLLLLLLFILFSASCSKEIAWGDNGLKSDDSDSTTIIITFDAPDRIEQIAGDTVIETGIE